ncbi:I78 family peptidase inhibitor [Novosphingobium sp. 1949]|uniref:I78 family peptidase inhibitor n=1 Tax=Novosphingobium organovorum TaxID=2930092 RepID=A0ABT0B9G1_9SPHN|nr:I78 family peptidase inhibitor [Novosphingobium organovorum]MCJ2181701.1 I78 family peptidase inhibitor [Novosphingobium organovorum]
MIRPISTAGLLPILAASLLAGLGGCSATTEPPTSPPPSPARPADCGAAQLGAFLGREASETVLTVLRSWRGDKPVRVLKPGSAMTMDYHPDRLNVFLDDTGHIDKFACN